MRWARPSCCRLWARRAVAYKIPGDQPGLALALGGLGVTLQDMVQLYAAMARGGVALPLTWRKDGDRPEGERLISSVAAWEVGDILAGLAPAPGAPSNRLAYKTGTSYGHRDAWAIGFDGRHVIGVWIGRADGTPVPGAFGAEVAAPVLFQAFNRLKRAHAVSAAVRLGQVDPSLPPGVQTLDPIIQQAMAKRPDLPKEQRYLAWLDLDSQEGQEYWAAMNLMGEYAAANHACIHKAIAKHMGVDVLADVENHHNFAWKETHEIVQPDGSTRREEVVVHRKGATPASPGVLGVIPGTMAHPGYVVMGKGSAASLHSSSHGAGRAMSPTKAREKYRFGSVRGTLAAQGITVLSAGADESPGAYKDIEAVMARQRDLVEAIARFDPAIVKMAPEGEKAED